MFKKMVKIVCVTIIYGLFSCSKKEDKVVDPTDGPQAEGVKTLVYNGWKDSVELTNGIVRVVVVPAIGRIMYYGFADGDNLLWDDPGLYGTTLPPGQPYRVNNSVEWANFGGDKVWPTEQADFPQINDRAWPPDHWFDGGAHTATLIDSGVVVTSQVSLYCGAKSIRTIRLLPKSSRLVIDQVIEKVQQAQKRSVEPISYTIWNVTQIRPPEQILFKLNPTSTFSGGYKVWSGEAAQSFSVNSGIGVFIPHPSNSQKAGADADDWLAASVGRTAVAEFFTRIPGPKYPDDGCSAEAYTSRDYTELELLSPLQRLAVGESMSHHIAWELFAVPADAVTPEQKRQKVVEWLQSQNGM